MLKHYGLKPVASHFETPLITGNSKPWLDYAVQQRRAFAPESMTWAQAIEDATKFGVEYMVMAYQTAAGTWRLGLFQAARGQDESRWHAKPRSRTQVLLSDDA